MVARVMVLLALAAAWALAVWQMLPDWRHDPEYHYCWAVPALAAYLATLRWADRPAAAAEKGGGVALALLLLAWIPALVVREANPDWRPVGAALTALALGLTAWTVRRAAGRKMLAHFAWPLGFMFLAVPWPSWIEHWVTGALMPLNARAAAGVLGSLGLNVACRGNLIELPVGVLDVEEACSGIRSLQGVLMSAIFLGEMLRVRLASRAVLVVAGVAFAMLTNVARTTVLGLVAAHEGLVRVHAAHDLAGLTILGVNFALLWLLAAKLPKSPPVAPPVEPGRGEWPLRAGVAMLVGLVSAQLFSEAWFRRRETSPQPPWHVAPPAEAPDFREVPISDRTALMLRASAGWSAKWQGAAGTRWHGLFFRWKPGTTPPGHLNVHRPEGCLDAIGLRQEAELAPLLVTAGGHQIRLRAYRFRDGDVPLHVFYGVQGDFPLPPGLEFDFTYRQRAISALEGWRNGGQRMIELGIWSASDETAARAMAAEFLRQHVRSGEVP